MKEFKKLDYFDLASTPINKIWTMFNVTDKGHSTEEANQVEKNTETTK